MNERYKQFMLFYATWVLVFGVIFLIIGVGMSIYSQVYDQKQEVLDEPITYTEANIPYKLKPCDFNNKSFQETCIVSRVNT